MDINKILNEIPSKKARATQEAEELRLIWQKEKEVYANKEAKFMLLKKLEEDIVKSTELKVLVQDDLDLHKNRLELIVMESKYRKKENEVEVFDDEFTSAKMMARLKISELGSIEFNK